MQPHDLFFTYVYVHTQNKKKKKEILETGLTVTTPSPGSVFLALNSLAVEGVGWKEEHRDSALGCTEKEHGTVAYAIPFVILLYKNVRCKRA